MRYVLSMLVLIATAIVVNSRLAVAGDLPKPAPTPSTQPTVPGGEDLFLTAERTCAPGMRTWAMGCKGDMWVWGTSQSVGDGAGWLVYVPAGGEIAPLCAYDTGIFNKKKNPGVATRELTDYKGLCLWFKGDGSDATAVLTTGYVGDPKNRFTISMKDTTWHKVFIPWEKWGVVDGFWFLTFSMERTDKSKANWYIVDRIHLYKEEKTEEITPTPDSDPPGMIAARNFVSGRENITKTLAKLKTRKPVKIVIAGDSIPCGAQLWYSKSWEIKDDDPRAYSRVYWYVLGNRLKEAFGYGDVSLVMHAYGGKDKPWRDVPATRPTSDLNIVGVVMGGFKAGNGLENIDQILAEKPDLVIWEYGANDATYGSSGTTPFPKATEEAVAKVTAAGAEVILQTITPTPSLIPQTWLGNMSPIQRVAELNKDTRRIATEKKIAVADMEQAFICRGAVFLGSLYADGVHPNHLGHEMMADVLDALITERDVTIWRYGPAAAKAIAATQPAK